MLVEKIKDGFNGIERKAFEHWAKERAWMVKTLMAEGMTEAGAIQLIIGTGNNLATLAGAIIPG